MEKPSLEIGNSNWAIKEGELLGYNRAGNDYLPIPITMTRASLGTRVNPESLVEDVALLGVEEVEDGNFPTPNTEWAFIGTTEISGGTANFPDSTNSFLIQENIIDLSVKRYKLTYNVVSTNGNNFRLAGGNSAFVGTFGVVTLDSATVGVKTVYLISNGTKRNLQFNNHNFIGSIDNVSLKEVTIDNLARVDYTDGTSSLLVEPQRTNLIPYSEDFNSWYAQDYVTVTEDTSETTSPSGNNTASKITINSVSTVRRLYEIVTTSSGNDYTFTLYAKKGTTDYIRFFLNSNIFDVTFDLTNGTKTVTTGSGSIESVGNDWYRLQATGTSSLTIEVPQIQLSNSASVNDYLYIWGAQFEEGSYATSYIPNFGTTAGVTRVKDQYEKTGISDLINSTEGVLFVEVAMLSDDLTNRFFSISNGSKTERVLLGYSNVSNKIFAFSYVGNVLQCNISFVLPNMLDYNKIALKYKLNDFALWVNGVEVGTDLVGSVSTSNTINKLGFDEGDGTDLMFSKVKQLQVYKTALTDDELTILTGTSGVHFFPSYASMASDLTYTIE